MTSKPTWKELTRIEPRLLALYRAARKIREERWREENRQLPFCLMDTYYQEIKPKLLRLVGFYAQSKNPRIRTSEAFDVAFKKVHYALPVCDGCECPPMSRHDRDSDITYMTTLIEYHYDFRSPDIKRSEFSSFKKTNDYKSWYNCYLESSENRCYYCKKKLDREKGKIHIDHMIPLSKYGSNDTANLAVTCNKCNLEKHDDIWDHTLELDPSYLFILDFY
jgi:hypothetical protein